MHEWQFAHRGLTQNGETHFEFSIKKRKVGLTQNANPTSFVAISLRITCQQAEKSILHQVVEVVGLQFHPEFSLASQENKIRSTNASFGNRICNDKTQLEFDINKRIIFL